MAKVITFTRRFPAYHSKAGKDTFFPEKVIKGLELLKHPILEVDELELDEEIYEDCEPKFHTVRAGSRWKAGEMASLRVWSGKPYHTKQVTLAHDVRIENVWNFEVKDRQVFIAGNPINAYDVQVAAVYDGLSFSDFLEWFKYPHDFNGQIICWNKSIQY
jgi:hypothetical protein